MKNKFNNNTTCASKWRWVFVAEVSRRDVNIKQIRQPPLKSNSCFSSFFTVTFHWLLLRHSQLFRFILDGERPRSWWINDMKLIAHFLVALTRLISPAKTVCKFFFSFLFLFEGAILIQSICASVWLMIWSEMVMSWIVIAEGICIWNDFSLFDLKKKMMRTIVWWLIIFSWIESRMLISIIDDKWLKICALAFDLVDLFWMRRDYNL